MTPYASPYFFAFPVVRRYSSISRFVLARSSVMSSCVRFMLSAASRSAAIARSIAAWFFLASSIHCCSWRWASCRAWLFSSCGCVFRGAHRARELGVHWCQGASELPSHRLLCHVLRFLLEVRPCLVQLVQRGQRAFRRSDGLVVCAPFGVAGLLCAATER